MSVLLESDCPSVAPFLRCEHKSLDVPKYSESGRSSHLTLLPHLVVWNAGTTFLLNVCHRTAPTMAEKMAQSLSGAGNSHVAELLS